ncbi:MAG: ATP-binding protein [Thermodesulfobacteriota bacterium]
MKRRAKLLWRLFPYYLAVILISVSAMWWYITHELEDLVFQQTVAQLKSQSTLVSELIGPSLRSGENATIDALCKKVGKHIETRITVISPAGEVLADSEDDPNRMEDHSARSEVIEATSGKPGVSSRYSFTLNQTMIYVATPLSQQGRMVAIVRVSKAVKGLAGSLRPAYFNVTVVGLIVALLASAIAFQVSRSINRPISRMKEGAQLFAAGDLEYRLNASGGDELADLADALNSMAAQLHDRVTLITEQRNELEAVLGAMVEAVLLVDPDERILRANRAAERLFGIETAKVAGRRLGEVVRIRSLRQFVEKVLAAGDHVEDELTIVKGAGLVLQANGTPLRGAGDRQIGMLIVLNDVTNIKKLERIRRDFVANVSRELRRPIILIQGFLDKLKEGSIRDPESATQLLDTVINQTDRLNLIIEDLLTLARIERDTEKGEVELLRGDVGKVVESAVRVCRGQASERGIGLNVECEEGLIAAINASLLEQAVMHLVDNAIRFSEENSSVTIRARRQNGETAITVSDQGCGIPREHLERIFERFYQVEEPHRQAKPGSGLGLAIVRHVVNAHHGRVEVTSSPGKGSTFTMFLPAA